LPTGSSHSPEAGLWGPDDGRLSRPVLRAAGGENPPADSPALKGPTQTTFRAIEITRHRSA